MGGREEAGRPSLRAGSLVGRISWAKELARRMGRGKVTFSRLILLARFAVFGSLSPTQKSEPARRLGRPEREHSRQQSV